MSDNREKFPTNGFLGSAPPTGFGPAHDVVLRILQARMRLVKATALLLFRLSSIPSNLTLQSISMTYPRKWLILVPSSQMVHATPSVSIHLLWWLLNLLHSLASIASSVLTDIYDNDHHDDHYDNLYDDHFEVATLPLTTLNSYKFFFHIIYKLKFVTILAEYILSNSSEICICIL